MISTQTPYTPPEALRSFGRRRGRPLRENHDRLWNNLLPMLRLDMLAPTSWANGAPLWMEIGFGGGEHLAALAERHPTTCFIGCEPFHNGVAKLLQAAESSALTNLRIHTDDARDVLRALPAGSLQRCYLLYPDPWPKIRHHKRRIVNAALLDLLAHALPVGGCLYLATDHEGYGQWMLEHFLADARFRWTAQSAANWCTPPEGWVPTRYEIKCLEGTPPLYLQFERV
jgi:tRNA (guanine-N7-)-methyltransferase